MTHSLKQFRSEVEQHLDRLLADHGLSRRRAGDYQWPIRDGFDGWFGLRLVSRPEYGLVRVEEFVGVRSAAVEAIVRRLGGDGSRSSWHQSASTQLWNLTPDKAMWLLSHDFYADRPIRPIAEGIVDAFETYGRPWAEARATLAALRDELAGRKQPFDSPAIMPRRLAAHLLCGDRAAAEADLESTQAAARQRVYDPTGFRELVATWTARFPEVAAEVPGAG